MALYQRKLLKDVQQWINKKTIVVVTGMRRVGKTTLFRMLYDKIKTTNKVFLDLENPLIQKVFQEENYDNITANLQQFGINVKKKTYLFLDEIQTMPSIIPAIKYLFDHHPIQFFLTGSSSFYLKNLFPESLAGRKILFELYPLDFEEFLAFKGVQKVFYSSFKEKDELKNEIGYQKVIKFYEEYLEFGGFPQVVLAETKEEKKKWLEDIFKSYFEHEVRTLADIKEIRVLRDVILLLMQRTGTKLNINNLSEEIGVSRPTLYSYLSFLEATYFINMLSPFSRNVGQEVSGAKKVYFCDTGILNAFARVSSGAILENALFQAVHKNAHLSYYERRSGGEIDFIVDKKIALEVKETGTPTDLSKLKQLSLDLKLKECYVITKKFKKEKGFICACDM